MALGNTGLAQRRPLEERFISFVGLDRATLRNRIVALVIAFSFAVWLLKAVRWRTTRAAMSSFDGNQDGRLTVPEMCAFLNHHGFELNTYQMASRVAPLSFTNDTVAADVAVVANKLAHANKVAHDMCVVLGDTSSDTFLSIAWNACLEFWLYTCSLFCSIVAFGWLVGQARDQDWLIVQMKRKQWVDRFRSAITQHRELRELAEAKEDLTQAKKTEVRELQESLIKRQWILLHRGVRIKQLQERQRLEEVQNEELQKTLHDKEAELGALQASVTLDTPLEAAPTVEAVYFLFASPMRAPNPPGSCNFVPVAPLRVMAERRRLHESFLNARPGATQGSGARRPRIRTRLAVPGGSSLIDCLSDAKRSGVGSALHLSLHGALLGRKQEAHLLLEDLNGDGQWINARRLQQLLGVGGREGCSSFRLCFLNCCHGESFAQVFLQAGCRYVVCLRASKAVLDSTAVLFTGSLYDNLGAGVSVPEAFAKAKDRLRGYCKSGGKDPALEADNFLLFERVPQPAGCPRIARVQSVDLTQAPQMQGEDMSRRASETSTEPTRRFLLRSRTDSAPPHAPPSPRHEEQALPARTHSVDDESRVFRLDGEVTETPAPGLEDFIGYSDEMVYLLDTLRRGRRCACVYGPSGIGKSSLLKALVHFANCSGRLFADAAILVSIDESVPQRQRGGRLAHRGADFVARLEAAVADGLSRLGAAEASQGSKQEPEPPPILARVPSHMAGLVRKLRELLQRQPYVLLALDGLAQSQKHNEELGMLLECCPGLYVLTAARDAWKPDLLGFKVIPVQLGGLDPHSAAQLLMKRSRRPFTEADFALTAAGAGPPARPVAREEVELQLAKHPVLRSTHFSPGRVRQLAERVTPELRSLYDLLDEPSDATQSRRASPFSAVETALSMLLPVRCLCEGRL